MKLLLTLLFCLLTGLAFADVSAQVLSIEKEVINGNPIVKVTTEYTYPDATKHLGTTRYSYATFSKASVQNDVEEHCATIVKYYLKENVDAVKVKKDEMVNDFISTQNTLPGGSPEKVTEVKHTLKSLYLDDLDLTLDAKGTILDAYK